MKSKRIPFLIIIILFISVISCTTKQEEKAGNFRIGWASVDVTPSEVVLIGGQFHARVSEGIRDPLTVTALAMESGTGPSSEKVIMISGDIIGSNNQLLENVRNLLTESIPEISPEKILLNATHTHAGPLLSTSQTAKDHYGVDVEAMSPAGYLEFLSERIAEAAEQAWQDLKPGGISYGLSHAVISHNRLQAGMDESSRMYGSINRPDFSHIEGFEDHSVHLLYTWDNRNNLTGVVINAASPSQVTESIFEISADYWHETRNELRRRLGDDLFVLPQCSAAGDQSPHVMVETSAEDRMQQLMFPEVASGRGTMARRKQISVRIADAVTSILPQMEDNIDWDPVFAHKMEKVELSRRLIGSDDVNEAISESEKWGEKYEEMIMEIEQNPSVKEKARWYTDVSRIHTLMRRGQRVQERFELEKREPKMPIEVHVVRIGDIAMATNPFELYVDYAVRIKGRSPAVQTFIVQLANGSSGYLPTSRSVAGGAYGAVPASTQIGPEGGVEFVEGTLRLINDLWED